MRVLLALMALAVSTSVSAADSYSDGDPIWTLLHEPAVERELQLSAEQGRAYRGVLDELDLKFFPLRNKSRDEALAGATKIIAEAKQRITTLLKPAQVERLVQLQLWQLGTPSVLSDEISQKVHVSDAQRKRIERIFADTEKAVAPLKQQVSEGAPREPLEKKYNDLKVAEQRKALAVLKPEQQQAWKAALGEPFDLKQLGAPAFRAPELIDTGEWINSSPLTLKQLRGKVVVLHFYTCGCINCIHNYPTYLDWQKRFKDQDIAFIGIHTPETASEREVANVRRKAAEAGFEFPIVIDGKSENWIAWGNSMWPSVYVIDRRGYMRAFWPGELKWQGATGDQYMLDRIEALLKEPAPSSKLAER